MPRSRKAEAACLVDRAEAMVHRIMACLPPESDDPTDEFVGTVALREASRRWKRQTRAVAKIRPTNRKEQ
jgi:hypothetical protein